MLKAAFEVDGSLAWEAHPVIYALQTHFSLVPADALAHPAQPSAGDGGTPPEPKT
jgi:hypothetical protein